MKFFEFIPCIKYRALMHSWRPMGCSPWKFTHCKSWRATKMSQHTFTCRKCKGMYVCLCKQSLSKEKKLNKKLITAPQPFWDLSLSRRPSLVRTFLSHFNYVRRLLMCGWTYEWIGGWMFGVACQSVRTILKKYKRGKLI